MTNIFATSVATLALMATKGWKFVDLDVCSENCEMQDMFVTCQRDATSAATEE
jgi:hypothetical protein